MDRVSAVGTLVVAACSSAELCQYRGARSELNGARLDRVLRIRGLLARGMYHVSATALADAILRRLPGSPLIPARPGTDGLFPADPVSS